MFVTVIYFRPSLIFVGKAGFHTSGASVLRVGPLGGLVLLLKTINCMLYKTMHVSEKNINIVFVNGFVKLYVLWLPQVCVIIYLGHFY